jgi:hypothetical protein
MSTGYNWRNTLTNFASISGVLAGFCVAFIGIVLGWEVANAPIYREITFGHVAVLLFGISTGLFICSAELFLHAKEYDVFSIPEPYRKLLKEDKEQRKEDWAEFEDEQTKQCRRSERLGRYCYNIAIFLIFIGLLFVIAPYNIAIAIIVSGLGILLEIWQVVR